MMAQALIVSVLLMNIGITLSSKDYTDCKWFGNKTNAPFYPIDVCTAHSHETELDGLWLYSTKMECTDNGELNQYEWNNTDCYGASYNTITYRKEDGYYFNCKASTSCSFTKIILWELANIDNQTANGHNGHLCAFDMNRYHELTIVTNICIDFIEEYNTSFYIQCDPKTVSFVEYNDTECKIKNTQNDNFVVKEGCDDPFDINAYIQIAECEVSSISPTSYNPTSSPTNAPTIVPTLALKQRESKNNNNLAIICTIIIGIVLIILIIMIGLFIMRRKSQTQINLANIDSQTFVEHDFKSIGDIDAEPDSTQHITTQGQDIQEIPIQAPISDNSMR